MKHSKFKIGTEFLTGSGRWRCTDVGTRTIVAIKLDLDRYKKDVADPEVAARVDADQKLGASRGVTSTPTLFVNTVLLPVPDINPAGLHKTIEAALKEKSKP